MAEGDAAQLTDLTGYIKNVLVAIIPLIGIISFIMILVGGYSILTSGGNPESLKKGKATLGSSIAGLALSIISYLVLVIIENITDVKVTNFRLGVWLWD